MCWSAVSIFPLSWQKPGQAASAGPRRWARRVPGLWGCLKNPADTVSCLCEPVAPGHCTCGATSCNSRNPAGLVFAFSLVLIYERGRREARGRQLALSGHPQLLSESLVTSL